MDMDFDAPAVATGEIDIRASPAVVWEVLADVAGWPAWNPDVSRASIDAALRPGTVFRWKAGPGTIVSTIRQADRPSRLGWTGRTLGIRAKHAYRLEQSSAGTRVTTEESWDGLPVRLFTTAMRRTLSKSVAGGLKHLKAEAERRAATDQPHG